MDQPVADPRHVSSFALHFLILYVRAGDNLQHRAAGSERVAPGVRGRLAVWIIDEILKFIGRNFVLAGSERRDDERRALCSVLC